VGRSKYRGTFPPPAEINPSFPSPQRGPVAGGEDDQGVHAAAQHPAAGGGGRHRPQPVAPLPAPQQGHPDEDAEESRPLHVVRPQAAGDPPA